MKPMQRKMTAILAAALLLLSFSFTGCRERTKFEKVDTSLTTTEKAEEQTTDGQTQTVQNPNAADGQKFAFAVGIEMGMSVKQVQNLIGVQMQTTVVDNRKNAAIDFSGVFINYANVKTVQFMFDKDKDSLEQIQFQCNSESDGAVTADAVQRFNQLYGKHAEHQGKYKNYVWYSGGVYIILSAVDNDNYIVTYTEGNYFKEHFKDEYKAYQQAK